MAKLAQKVRWGSKMWVSTVVKYGGAVRWFALWGGTVGGYGGGVRWGGMWEGTKFIMSPVLGHCKSDPATSPHYERVYSAVFMSFLTPLGTWGAK